MSRPFTCGLVTRGLVARGAGVHVGSSRQSSHRNLSTVRILGFGTYDVARHPRVGIILAGLRAHGAEVIEANDPLGLSTAERIEMVRHPWRAYRLVLELVRCWWRVAGQVRRLRQAGPVDAVVVGYLGQFDVLLARALFPRTRIVLDQLVFGADTGIDRGLSGVRGGRHRLLHLIDRLAVRSANLVVIDTVENRQLLSDSAQDKAVVVAVGASEDWFAAGRTRALATPEQPLRVVFFGLFTPLQGTEVIAGALAALSDCADIEVTMIGSGQGLADAQHLAASNGHITWHPWIDAAELPAVVAAHDVCLGIFGTSSKALRVTPNKVFQGAAAGCVIVTSDTPPQRRTMGSAALLVPAGDPHRLATVLRELAGDRERVTELAAAARALALAGFTASAVTEPLWSALVELEEHR